jgi:hypothetical protein
LQYRKSKRTMHSESEGGLQISDLPEDTTKAARSCGDKLKAGTFQKVSIGVDSSGVYEIWNGENLMELCGSFIATFPPLKKASRPESIVHEK